MLRKKERAAVLSASKAGVSNTEIAAECGLTDTRIGQIIKAHHEELV